MLTDAQIYGDFPGSHSPQQLGQTLARQGLRVQANPYCVRILDCSHFKLEVFDGTVTVDGDADTVEEAIRDAELVSLTSSQGRYSPSVHSR